MGQLLVEHISARRSGRAQLAGGIVKPQGALERPVVLHDHRALDAVGAELGHLLVQGLALPVGGDLDHVEVLAAAAGEAGGLFGDLVGILPVEAREAHPPGQLRDDPPVRFGAARRIVEPLIQPQPALAVGADEILLAPGRGGEDDVGELVADRVDQIDVLVDDDHAAGIDPFAEGFEDFSPIDGTYLMRVAPRQLVEFSRKLLRAAHRLDPGRADDMRHAGMTGHGPGIGIERPAPAAGQFHRRLVARVLPAPDAAALVAAAATDDLAGAPAAAADDAKGRDRLGVAGVVRPVEALLDHDRGLRALAADRLRHHPGRQHDLLGGDAGDLGGGIELELVLGHQPLGPVVIAVGLELAPGGAPLPGRVAGALAEARGAFPLVVDPVLDPLLVLPAVLDDDPGDGVHHQQVGARCDVEPETAVLLGIGDSGGAPGQHEDRLLAVLDALHDPLREQDRLGLVGIGAADQQRVRIHPVLVSRGEVVEPGIAEPRGRADIGRRVVEGEVGRVDRAQGVFGDRVGVLDILIREGLDAERVGPVLLDHVFRHLGGDIQREIPGDRLQDAVDPHHRRFQAVAGRGLLVVALLGDAAAAQRRVAIRVDKFGLLVGDDYNMMGLVIVQHDVVLVGGDPGPEHLDREIRAERVLARLRAAVPAADDRPAVDLVAAGDDAVVARGGQHVGILGGQGDVGFWNVVWSRHFQLP